MLTRRSHPLTRCGARWPTPTLGYIGLILACLLTTPLSSSNARAYGQTPNFFHHQAWSTEDGLPQESVHALLQSHEGYLWIATEDGAARFDGQGFQILNHETTPVFSSNDVSCLAEDQTGNIWFGTSDGLVRKHGEQYRRFSQKDGLPSDQILALAASASGMLALTSRGLASLGQDHFESVVADKVFASLTGNEREPALVSRTGVYAWQDGQLVSVAPATQDGAIALGAAIGPNQAVWTYGSNFVQLSSPSQKKTWRTGVDLPGSRVQALYVDRQGTAWIGTNRGLSSVETGSGLARESEALRGESILSILVDREGDLWAGTEASGLHVLQPREFATVPGSNSEAVTTVALDRLGVMYFGTREDGIFRAADVAVPIAPNKLTSPVILSLAAEPNGDLWAGTPDGLNHIAGADVRHWTIADGLPDNFIRSVIVSADKTVWAGTRFGLVHLVGNAVQTFTKADGLQSDSIGPLLEARSREGGGRTLWIGTSAGLCRQTDHQFRCLSAPDATSGIITALGDDADGNLWVGLHGHGLGVVRQQRIVPIVAAALPAEIVGIVADTLGNLWLRSTRGLYRAPISKLTGCAANPSACSDVSVEAYGRSDGVQSDQVAGEGFPSGIVGPNGELWFASSRGIATTAPQYLFTNRVPPGVAITRVSVDGAQLPLDTPAAIRPGHRQYSFEYAGLNLNNPASIHCRYALDGFDPGWVDAGTRRTAYYTNLPPRQYAFKVACANGDGVWSTDEASFHIRVLRPWYRSIWIYVAAVFLAGAATFGFVRLRVRAERKRFDLVLQERSRVAREVHDTLAQDLVSVSLQVELAVQHAKAGRLADTTEQLVQTRLLVRRALESARQSIWNLRANYSKASLPVRLTARVDAFRGENASAQLRISGEYRSALPAIENEVMRIATEAISNVERHSGATELLVSLSYAADSLRLQVRDNGRGFDYTTAREMADHYGLKGLEERAALLHAQLTVESTDGQGTTVTLIAPLPAEKT